MMSKRTVFTPQRYEPGRKQISKAHIYIEKNTDPPGLIVKEINEFIGKGVFAERKFSMGSFLMEYHGDLISKNEGTKREKWYPKEYGSFLLFFKCGRSEMCVDATFSNQLGRFVNDSIGYKRNADLKIVFVHKTPHIALFAARNISKGEEIRYDYGVSNLPWRYRHKACNPQVLLHSLNPGADTFQYQKEDGTFAEVIIKRHLKTEANVNSENEFELVQETVPNDSREMVSHVLSKKTITFDNNYATRSIEKNQQRMRGKEKTESETKTADQNENTSPQFASTKGMLEFVPDSSLNVKKCESQAEETAFCKEDCISKNAEYETITTVQNENTESAFTSQDGMLEFENQIFEHNSDGICLNNEELERLINSEFIQVDIKGHAKSIDHQSSSTNVILENPYYLTTDVNTDECVVLAVNDRRAKADGHFDNLTVESSTVDESDLGSVNDIPSVAAHFNKSYLTLLDDESILDSTGHLLDPEPGTNTMTEEYYTADTTNTNDTSSYLDNTLQSAVPSEEDPVQNSVSQLLDGGLRSLQTSVSSDFATKEIFIASKISITESLTVPEYTIPTCIASNEHQTTNSDRQVGDSRPGFYQTSENVGNNMGLVSAVNDQCEKQKDYWKKRMLSGLLQNDNMLIKKDGDNGCTEALDFAQKTTSNHSSFTDALRETDNREVPEEPVDNTSMHNREIGGDTGLLVSNDDAMKTTCPMMKVNLVCEDVSTLPTQSCGVDSKTPSNKPVKSRKPPRPCPFCGVFKTKLSNHIKRIHKTKHEVIDAMSLPKQEREEKFAAFRKRGIFNENMKKMADNRTKDSISLIPERRHTQMELVTCISCKAFLSKRQFYKHKRRCNQFPLTRNPPNCVSSIQLAKLGNKEILAQYESQIIERFRNDEVGEICKSDNDLRMYGFKKFVSFGDNYAKKDEKRKSTMSTMRQVAKLFLDVKEYNVANSHTDVICSVRDIFNRKYIDCIKEIVQLRKLESNSDSLLNLGNSVKRFVRFLTDYLTNEGHDAEANEINRFLGSFKYNWSEMFGESEYGIMAKRSETRKPSNLPDETELKLLTKYVKTSIKTISEDSYAFIAEAEYTYVRDLLVCRLTLFNARRGGEPSRLTIQQWNDAENDIWKHNLNPDRLENPNDIDLLQTYKVAYQPGKNDGKLVPVIFPDDCHEALRLMCNPEVRKDAGVNKFNAYLFPSTNQSDRHCIGSDSIRSIRTKVGVKSITATKVRHRAATLHAALEVTDHEREAFFRHMGHSDNINKHVYQCPPALMEVTKVGKFFRKLDEDLENDTKSSSIDDRNTSCIKEQELVRPSTSTDSPTESSLKELETAKPSMSKYRQADSSLQAGAAHERKEDGEIKGPGLQLIHQDTYEEEGNFHKRLQTGAGCSTTEGRIDTISDNRCCEIRKDSNTTNIERKRNNDIPSTMPWSTPKERQYVRWIKEDTEKLTCYFSEYVYDVSRYDAKGVLPGYTAIRKFLRANPGILQDLPEQQKIRTIHTKLNNERNKMRRCAKKHENQTVTSTS